MERIPAGVRLTPLGAVAVELARGLPRESETSVEKIIRAISGRTGGFHPSAMPIWVHVVLAPAFATFRDRLPGEGPVLLAATFGERLKLLTDDENDLHCVGGYRRTTTCLPAA